MSEDHQRFTVDRTAFMRSLDRTELYNGEWIAVHYQDPPICRENGARTIHMRFPALIVASYLTEPRKVADKVARILNQHWDDDE